LNPEINPVVVSPHPAAAAEMAQDLEMAARYLPQPSQHGGGGEVDEEGRKKRNGN
jgi:hypothetical protein